MDAKVGAHRQKADTASGARQRRRPASIVPAGSVAGRSLVAVVAIMTFLASLTVGAVDLIHAAASSWESEIVREVTVQVRPTEGRDLDDQVRQAVDIARAAPGITGVRPYSEAESAALLEPWLGSGLDLTGLPVPRLIILSLAPAGADLGALKNRLEKDVTGASVDDHRQWVGRLRDMAGALIGIGLGVLGLVCAATIFSVVFATRGTMAGNRETIEVLNLVGASDSFIAREFQRHFLRLGLLGGVLGGGAATLMFLVAGLLSDSGAGSPAVGQMEILFGRFSLSAGSYVVVALVAIAIAIATAITSRLTVARYLRRPD